MKKIVFLCVCLLSCSTVCTNAQTTEFLTPSKYAFRLARLLLKDGTAKTGWVLGTQSDSLVIQIGSKSERIARHELLRVAIETEASRSKSVLIGMLAGMYFGSAIALKAEHQPVLFLRDREAAGSIVLANALFALAGGGVAYLFRSAGSGETTFDFGGTEQENATRWAQLIEGYAQAGRKGTFHLSVEASSVSGPLPKVGANNMFSMQPASPWNMMRKLQLSYSITNFLDAGIASLWLGQPSLQYYNPGPNFGYTSIDLAGRGYYVVAAVEPLWQAGWRDVQWEIGTGVGMASMEFSARSETYSYPPIPQTPPVEKRTSSFSAVTYTELKVMITDNVSIGLTAELVYIPEDVPEVPGLKFESTTLGTSSIGLVLGFHL